MVHRFPCAALSGWLLAREIVTWIHSVVDELQECDPIDSLFRRFILFFKIIYFALIYVVATD